jgi:DNA-binding NarL/FixJ family response regulator
MKLMIVDDHELFREGLAAIIKSELDVEIVGLASSVKEAVEMAHKVTPDIILMDFGLPDGSGADASRAILADDPACRIIFLTVYADDENLFSAIRSGAKGYLLKNTPTKKMLMALRSVMQGEGVLSWTMTVRMMEELSQTKASEPAEDAAVTKLTSREVEVIRELASGMTNQEIANRLFLSKNTVKHYMRSIFGKLNLENRRAAANYAREHGLLK